MPVKQEIRGAIVVNRPFCLSEECRLGAANEQYNQSSQNQNADDS
jgi:hypothetical protein